LSLSLAKRNSSVVLAVLWLFDLAFNLTAAATVLRYIIFIGFVEVAMFLWFLDCIIFEPKKIITSVSMLNNKVL